jgi:hypothetical protein
MQVNSIQPGGIDLLADANTSIDDVRLSRADIVDADG